MTGRTIARALKSNRNPSQTPGKSKGWNCQATPLAKGIAKRNRSYKMKEYRAWNIKHDGTKGGGR